MHPVSPLLAQDGGSMVGWVLVGLLLASNPELPDAPADATVRAYMQAPPASIRPDARIEQAAVLMLEHDVRGLPVTDDTGQLLGVLTVSDLLDAIVKAPPVVLWP